jgi:hydrogenase-4 component B
MSAGAWPLAVHLGAVGGLVAIALLAAASGRRLLALVYPVSIAAASLALLADLVVLLSDTTATLRLPIGLPDIGLRFSLDALAAYFGLIVNVAVVATGLYGLGLDRGHELSPRIEPFFAAFCAAMNLVVVADDAFAFLFFWELMSLASWALVVARHEDADSRFAGQVYLVMAAAGTAALLIAFGMLAGATGAYGFDEMRAAAKSPGLAALVLLAVFVGAGSKAGIMPLHAWLPLAHPAAPSHVSALMSGVMTKVAVYGVLRVVFDLLGPPVWWWSLPFVVLGAATAVGALVHAVVERDLKRVLAFSTIENVGVIFVGIGLALAFKATGIVAAATVALAAALLHALAHSWFKSLLFLGAGIVQHATGRRDLEALGGLIHRLPQTAAFFLVGTLAISALPPLNGFVSEWLLFQAVLAGPAFPEPVLRFLVPAVGALLALAAALAAACFVRVFGIAFLGRPRSAAAATAHEGPAPQRAALALLAGLCVCGGLFGSLIARSLSPLLMRLTGATLPGSSVDAAPFALVAFDSLRSIYDATTIAAFIAIATALTVLVVHRLSRRRTRRAPAWDCGFPDASPATQYTASSFGQPLRRVYAGPLLGAREIVDMPPPGDPRPARFEARVRDVLWDGLYRAPVAVLLALTHRINVLQFLSIRSYLAAMFAVLVLLLLFVVGTAS